MLSKTAPTPIRNKKTVYRPFENQYFWKKKDFNVLDFVKKANL